MLPEVKRVHNSNDVQAYRHDNGMIVEFLEDEVRIITSKETITLTKEEHQMLVDIQYNRALDLL